MKVNLVIAAASLAFAVATGALAQSQPRWKHVGTLGSRHMVLVETGATDPDLLKQAAKEVCAPSKPCVVAFWTEASAIPSAMPMTASQQEAMVAQYVRNPASGKEEVMLKCRSADAASTKCLR